MSKTIKTSDVSKIEREALVLIKLSQFNAANKLIAQYIKWPYQPESIPLLRIRAELYKHDNNFVDEAATYQEILQFMPNDNAALRSHVFAILHMGAPNLASKIIEQHPDVFSKAELLEIMQTSVGKSIKWGTVESKAGLGQQRFASTDKALVKSEDLRLLHIKEQKNKSLSGRYSEFDRIVALRDRVRMQEVIAAYQELKQQAVVIPAYVLAAVADAFLYERDPETARDIYLLALDANKNDRDYPNREWQLNLFNAYIEANQFDEANALIDHLANTIPPVINKGLRGVELDNEFYEDARTSQINGRIYAAQYGQSEELLDKALKTAPFNPGIRIAEGDLLQNREQPRAARKQYARVLVDDPSNSSAATGIAETAIALNDNETAKAQLDTLTRFYPENREVQRLDKLLAASTQPLLTVTSGWGESPTGGGRLGNEDWQVDTMLHSPSLYQHWRAFTHTYNAEATFFDTTGRRRRVGLGADYRSPSWRLSGELNQDQAQFNDYGFDINSTWQPTDHWAFDLGYDSNSNNVPLQAAVTGISMQMTKFGVNYVANESRSVNTSLTYGWLNDGNHRIEGGVNWQERWWSGPIYKLDTTLGVFTSDNSLTNTEYFNPQQDVSIEAQLNNEWTLWRKYRRSFKNRLILGTGNYWQKNFASGVTSIVRYEHEWNIDPYRTISYGAAYQRHPYDGEVNELTSVFLNLIWHL